MSDKFSITNKIDNISHIPEAYRKTVLPPPTSVKIELTGRCNFKCKYCSHDYENRPRVDMPWEVYQTLLNDFADINLEELGLFFIGEPFLDKRLPAAITEAHNYGIPYVFLTTNGSMADPKKVEEAMEAGLNSLKFSFNYKNADQFADITQVKPALWYKGLENLKEARRIRDKKGYNCGIYASYIIYNHQQSEEMEAVLDEHVRPYVDEVYALPLFTMIYRADTEKKLGWAPTAGNRGREGNLRPPLPCWVLFTAGHVFSNGDVCACCFGGTEFIIGNAYKDGFMNVWNSEAAQRLRQAHLNMDISETPCKGCNKAHNE